MRLLMLKSDGSFSLTKDFVDNIPPYAILSHTWGPDGEEVTFDDLINQTSKNKAGYTKLKFCANQAANDGLQYFWVDTCCINKSSSAELTEAINSMFQWYRDAVKCYVYLTDVSTSSYSEYDGLYRSTWKIGFRKSRWFTRGWTLQELVAPKSVEFFSSEGERLGDKTSLEQQIHEATGINVQALRGIPTSSFSVTERMSWAAKRETTRKEDKAYCLLGIFDIHMPLIYGEGDKARVRLEEEILKYSNIRAQTGPKSFFMVPFRRDSAFVGREDMLLKMLKKHEQAGHSRVGLVGLGGVGKSQIAIEYAYRVKESWSQTWVFWVHASNADRFKQAYRDIAAKVELPGRDDPKVDILQLVYNWLCNEINGQWLMIIDNADDDEVFSSPNADLVAQNENPLRAAIPLESFIPQSPNGNILVTSRDLVAAVNLVGSRHDVLQVEPMGEGEALSLLKTRLSVNESSEGDARALVQALEGIPLAVTHAAAYIAVRAPRITLSVYLQEFRQGEKNQAYLLNKQEMRDLRRDGSVSDAVIMTWQISFEQIRKTSPEAADLLSLMAMFDRQGIPKHLLYDGRSRLQFEDTMAPLIRFSLIRTQDMRQSREQHDNQSFEMHSLVQLAVWKWLEVNQQMDKWKKASLRIIAATFPSGAYETWAVCQGLLPHSRKVLGYELAGGKESLDLAKIANNTAWYLFLTGDYTAAENMCQIAMGVREKILGPDHPDTLRSVSSRGSMLDIGGKYEAAEAMHQRALKGYEKVLGLEHPDTLTSVSNLGLVLERLGKYEEAEAMHRRDLEGSEKVLGLEHPDTLTSVSNLGLVLERLGKYEEAEAMHRRDLEGSEKVLGLEHLDTLTSVNTLG